MWQCRHRHHIQLQSEYQWHLERNSYLAPFSDMKVDPNWKTSLIETKCKKKFHGDFIVIDPILAQCKWWIREKWNISPNSLRTFCIRSVWNGARLGDVRTTAMLMVLKVHFEICICKECACNLVILQIIITLTNHLTFGHTFNFAHSL